MIFQSLIAAFRATLEQTQYADVIVHVRDIAHADTNAHKQDVIKILAELGIDYEQDDRIIEVLNKTDLLDEDNQGEIHRQVSFNDQDVALSALTGEGCDRFLSMVEDIISRSHTVLTYEIRAADGQALSWLYDNGNVLEREDCGSSIKLTVALDEANIGRFKQRFLYDPLTSTTNKTEKYVV